MKRRTFIKSLLASTSLLAAPSILLGESFSEETLESLGEKKFTILDYVDKNVVLGGPKPTPVQRVVLKAIYGLPLDDRTKFPVQTSPFDSNTRLFTEESYLSWLYEEGRSNIREINPGQENYQMVFSFGRRAGKTTILNWVTGFEVQKLLAHENPNTYYGISRASLIGIARISYHNDLALSGIKESFRDPIFESHEMSTNSKRISFKTLYDLERDKDLGMSHQPSIQIRGYSYRNCSSMRGTGHILVAMDECAHYSSGKAELIYQTLAPSMCCFTPKDPKNNLNIIGPNESKRFLVSSPCSWSLERNTSNNFFHQKFKEGFEYKWREGALCLQIPTWEIYPRAFEEAPNKEDYLQDYGAVFTG